jgi:hypothetical protein
VCVCAHAHRSRECGRVRGADFEWLGRVPDGFRIPAAPAAEEGIGVAVVGAANVYVLEDGGERRRGRGREGLQNRAAAEHAHPRTPGGGARTSEVSYHPPPAPPPPPSGDTVSFSRCAEYSEDFLFLLEKISYPDPITPLDGFW